nr:MAG TPA: hypothetical protein [Caudoviricetes sp.]
MGSMKRYTTNGAKRVLRYTQEVHRLYSGLF